MKITPTNIKDCYFLEIALFGDDRGYFFESYNHKTFVEATGLNIQWVQDNQSKSKQNVVRGLHLQRPPYCQAKLVRVLEGSVLDVVVDVRNDSPTYGEQFSIELSAKNNRQLFVPNGLLHGFSVLSEEAVFAYKVDNYYHKESEDGVFPLDEDLNIDWRINPSEIILSEKDRLSQKFSKLKPVPIE